MHYIGAKWTSPSAGMVSSYSNVFDVVCFLALGISSTSGWAGARFGDWD